MKSKVTKMADLGDAVSRWPWKTKDSSKEIQDEIHQVVLKYRKYDTVAVTEKGDVVSLTMTSDMKKFNRTTKVSVGANLFDKNLEESLIGRKNGEKYFFSDENKSVDVTINEIARLVVPSLTDEMVKGENVEGVSTVSEYQTLLEKKQLDKQFREEYFNFLPVYTSECEYTIEECDIDEMDEYEMERCRKIAESMNLVFEKMTEEQLLGAVGCHNIEEFKSMIRTYHYKAIKTMLLGASIAGKTSEEITMENQNDMAMIFMDKVVESAYENYKRGV